MLDYKDRYILNLLLTTQQKLSVLDLSRVLSISKRSVYYSISRINDYLEENNLPTIENSRQNGLTVSKEVVDRLKKDLNKEIKEYYLCTQAERNAIEIMTFLFVSEKATVAYFEDLFQVSRNTIVTDIKEVKKKLSIYNLVLEYDHNRGYVVEGTPIRKRSVGLMIISSFDYLLKINNYGLIDREVSKDVISLFADVEKELEIKYVHNTLEYIAEMISLLTIHQIEQIHLFDEDINLIKQTNEYEIVEKIFKDTVYQREIFYIALQFLGMRVQNNPGDFLYENEEVVEAVQFMVDEFSRLTLIYFEDEEGLFNNLYLHMKQAIFRFRYGIIFQNTLKEEIFENYPQITQVTKEICTKLEKKLGYPIGDDDIAYITMHFGGYLKREKREIPSTKILLVCLNGIATSKLLKKELQYLLGNIDIIDVVRKEDIKQYKSQVDYIISTIPLDDESIQDKYIQVNTILTEEDKERIVHKCGINIPNQAELKLSNQIIEDLKDIIPTHKREEARRKVLSRLSHKNPLELKQERMSKPVLKELIDETKVIFKESVRDWVESIYVSGKPLLDGGYIEEKYLDKVVKNVKELGPYIVISPEIAISHARPEDGVNEIGMTLLILDKPVIFKGVQEKHVKVIVTLAAPDNEKHLLALQQLSMLFMESLDELLAAKNKETVLKLIEKYSNN